MWRTLACCIILCLLLSVQARPREVQGPVAPKPEIQSLVASVSADSLWRSMSELSGSVPVRIAGQLDTLLTRYSFSPRIDHAAEYLRERFEAYGYETSFHGFTAGRYDFSGVDFVDSRRGWVVGTTQRVFRTDDGGSTWIRQNPGAYGQDFLDVCFVDSLRGWVVGTGFSVYRTMDGGSTWAKQSVPSGLAVVWAVHFVDASNGWVAGTGGTIARTTNGGLAWTAVPSGTGQPIYDLHFETAGDGWAVGACGTILHWDGTAWSGQTSGTSQDLVGVCFVNDERGWAVGYGRTVLGTADGGETWTAQTVPAETYHYLADVCFADTSRGWIVGMGATALRTDDGGVTWEALAPSSGSDLRCVEFTSHLEGWVAGEGCVIDRTADGGNTWQDQRGGLPAGTVVELTNVVASKPGTMSDQEVILCGHYDSISETPTLLAPGADDDASGTAGVLEAARVLAAHPFQRTIQFVCFAAEEQGLDGSAQFAFDARRCADEIVGVLDLDMIGYTGGAPESIGLVYNAESQWLVDFAIDRAAAYVPDLGVLRRLEPYNVHGDQASFWAFGYDAFMAMEPAHRYNPAYHTVGDTLGLLTPSFVTDVTRMAVAAAAELALPDTVAGVLPGVTAGPVAVEISPNPFFVATRIGLVRGPAGRAECDVYDVEGRRVRTLSASPAAGGPCSFAWDGADEAGAQVAPGVYLAKLAWAGGERTAKVVKLR